MRRRVVVTGIGVVSPVGTGKERFWQAVRRGESGIGPVTRFDASGLPTRIAGEVKDFDPLKYMDRRTSRHMDRFTQFAVAAARMAVEDAKLNLSEEERESTGVIISSGIGGMETIEQQHRVLIERGPGRISPFFVPMLIANMAGGQVAIELGLKGPNMAVVSACASSANAIGEATLLIKRGKCQIALAGGSEAAITLLSFAGFCAMGAMSTRNEEPTRASRPFDRDRDGFVMGEGAGVLVLESLEHAQKRGAEIYAEIVGYASNCDAFHIVQPEPEGRGAAKVMEDAIKDASLKPEEVDYINAHGTGTGLNDRLETAAIKKVFGEHAYRLAVSSSKSMFGHLLGAAGAVELITTIMAIQDQWLPPTINLENPDPDCDLDYVPNVGRSGQIRVALSNSFGFGGHNVTLIVKRWGI
ncbi:MAG TPA: beta-ketoacyl-ACP synthase II [Firmicutes bacterium]|nr:beta-ketoacyl-ACP synthase II [Bacillota bacterium]